VVIWFGRIGDMIMLSALLAALHRRYGLPCLIVGAGDWTAEIYRSHGDVSQVCCLHRHRAFLFDPRWWSAVAMLRRSRAAPVYICETDPRKLRRIRRLLAISGTAPSRCVFMTEQLALAAGRGEILEHWVDRLLALARRTPPAFREADYPWPPAGARTGARTCGPRLEVTSAEKAQCQAWLRRQGWLGRTLILIQPGNQRTMHGKRPAAATDHKSWPVERWAALLRRIHERMPQAVLILVGAPAELALLERIRAAAGSAPVATAGLPLRQLFALCECAHSMISVDSGPAHAAAAMGLPLVVLFGAYPARVWQPRSALGSAVIGIGGPPASMRLDQIGEREAFEGWCALLETA
jgi:heptosyltransferase-2/heptosyltransferase-3